MPTKTAEISYANSVCLKISTSTIESKEKKEEWENLASPVDYELVNHKDTIEGKFVWIITYRGDQDQHVFYSYWRPKRHDFNLKTPTHSSWINILWLLMKVGIRMNNFYS